MWKSRKYSGFDILPDSNSLEFASKKNYHIENFKHIREAADYYIEHLDFDDQEAWSDMVHLLDYDKIINPILDLTTGLITKRTYLLSS